MNKVLNNLPTAVLLLVIVPFLSAESSFTEFENKTIGSVEIRADGPVDQEFLLGIIDLKPGVDTLTISRIRKSIELLYETGNFTNIIVNAETLNDRVQLIFELRLVYRFSFIRLRGDKGVSSGKLKKRMGLRKLEPYTPEKVLKAREELLRELIENGFYDAKVTPDVLLKRTSKRTEVIFQINAGPPAYVGSLNFTGDLYFNQYQIVKIMKSRPGKRFKEWELKRDIERLNEHYDKNGFVEKRITIARQELGPAHKMNLEMDIQAGKQIALETSGYEISPSLLEQNVPIKEEQSYADDTLEEGRRNLITFMQAEGYFDAQVSWKKTSEKQRLLITYEINPGVRYEIQEILISGNDHFPSSEIRKLMQTKESGFRKQRLITEVFQNDQKNVISAYQQKGFLFARLVRKDVQTLSNGKINIDLQIEEGPRVIVLDIRLKGNETFQSDVLMREFKLKIGEPISESKVQDDSNFMIAFYSDNGYPKVRVESRLLLSRDKTKATIEYRIHEGEQVFVDRIVINGNWRTKRSVIEKNLFFSEHDPLSIRKLIQSQSELYSLEIFDRVQMDIPRPDYLQKQQNVLIKVTESRPYTISYGFGYQTYDKLRGLFSISNRNLWGTDRSGTFLARGGTKENLILFSFFNPDLIAKRLLSTVTLQYENRALPGFSYREYAATFQTERKLYSKSAYLPIGAKVPPLKSVFFTYAFQDIITTACSDGTVEDCTFPDDPADIPFLPIQISSLSTSFVRDARDNSIYPTKGNFLNATLQYAAKFLGSETDFLKFNAEYLYFVPVKSTVLASAFRFGLAQAFLDTTVPVSQHFFAGGEKTIRGFPQDDAGPLNDNGDGIGGNISFIFNLESRFPLWAKVGGVVFFDYGFVFAEIEDFSFAGLRPCAGIGLRYNTPIGPLAIDWGFKLNRRPGESSNEVYFSVGNVF